MAAPRPFNVVSEVTAAPLPGVAGDFSVAAWDAVTLAPRTAPTVSDLGGGNYALNVSNADENVGTVVLVATTHEPRFWAFAVFKPDNSNQFFALLATDNSGALWAGAAPTLTGWSGSGGAPAVVTVTDGLYVVTPTALDVTEWATGTVVGAPGSLVAPNGIATDFSGAPPVPSWPVEPSGARVSYQRYQTQLAPPWLHGPAGESWTRGIGDAKDEVELREREAVLARYPSRAPKDALVRISADRGGLDKGVTETDAQWRARLRDAWSLWPWAGTFTGVLRALALAGYPNVYIVGGTGRYATLDGSGNIVAADGAPLSIGSSNLWNAIRLVFATPPAAWTPTPPAEFSAEVNNIRRIVMKWKPAVALFEGITVIRAGHVWGFPLTMKWGQPGLTWGASTITSWAGEN